MKRILTAGIGLLLTLVTKAQVAGRWSVEAGFGLQGNFFVINKFYADNRFSDGSAEFNRKNFIGTLGALEVAYNLGKRGALNAGVSFTANNRKIDFATTVNGVPVLLDNFRITHRNQFFQLGYQYRVTPQSPRLLVEAGLFYLRMQQQEVEISATTPLGISLIERDYNDYKLEEGGVFAGIGTGHRFTEHWEAGLRSRLYFLVSTGSFEAITLSPYIRYRF